MGDITRIPLSVYQKYLCPISYLIMQNPVNINNNDKITFELKVLNMWDKKMCPLTRQPITDIKTNFTMINEIKTLLEQYPELKSMQFNMVSFFDLENDVVDITKTYDCDEIKNNIHCFQHLIDNNFINHAKFYLDNIIDVKNNHEFLNMFAKISNINDDIFYYFTNRFMSCDKYLYIWFIKYALENKNINLCEKILNLPNINNILLLQYDSNLIELYINICNTNIMNLVDKYININKLHSNEICRKFFEKFITFTFDIQYLITQKIFLKVNDVGANITDVSNIIYELNNMVFNRSIEFNIRMLMMRTIEKYNDVLQQKILIHRQMFEEKLNRNKEIVPLPGFRVN